MPRPLGTLTAAALATCALSIAIAMPSGAAAGFIARGPVSDVVVNVTLGANDPVRGATVVARDDLTGRVVSETTTTGSLGYAVVRMLPTRVNRRITITATGGTSGAAGTLSRADDVLAVTVQRAAADAALEVNVNPATTIQAAYLDIRPRATLANSEKTVARRLGLTPDIPLDEAGRYSRVKFSGEAFAKEAEDRGGIDAYARWAASRIAAGAALPKYAAPGPSDDLPLRKGAPLKQENIVGSLVSSALGPLAEYGGRLLFCEIGIAALCPNQTPPPVRLPPEVLAQFNRIEQGISNLQVQLTTVRTDLNRLETGLIALSGQVQALNYQAEMNAVDDVLRATATAAGLRAQGMALPDSNRRVLENALRRRQGINNGCPNFQALIGQLPGAVVSRHPNAACTREGFGVPAGGLMQFAQRATAARLVAVAAGQTQGRVDAAGEYWLGELARNVFSVNASSTFAIREGTSTRDAATAAATGTMLRDVIRAIDADATGTYFGARIPTNQVLAVAPADGSVIYGIGSYRDPGNCRGGTLRPVLHRFSQGRTSQTGPWRGNPFSTSLYLPSGSDFQEAFSFYNRARSFPAIPGWVACTQAQLMQPPPPAPGTPAAPGWQPAASPSEGAMRNIRGPLRAAALCQVQAVIRSRNARGLQFQAGGDICVARSAGSAKLPDQINLEWAFAARHRGVLPNLQVSVGHDQCRPWEIGTSQVIPRRTRAPDGGIADVVSELVTAVGMQCPVVDLTPNAPQLSGWNCVSANPQGQVATQPGGNAPPLRVTSSLRVLNHRSMGGYCPNWGWQPLPAGSVNYSQHAGSLNATWNPRPNGLYCSPGLRVTLRSPISGFRFSMPFGYYEGAAIGQGRERRPNGDLPMPCEQPYVGIPPRPVTRPARLQELIGFMTTYFEPCFCGGNNSLRSMRPVANRLQRFRELGIGDQNPHWTLNNGVAGDFVVGPLYTSNAVGAFVPGLSPGGPVPAAPRRRG
jgi:hypothetical protein